MQAFGWIIASSTGSSTADGSIIVENPDEQRVQSLGRVSQLTTPRIITTLHSPLKPIIIWPNAPSLISRFLLTIHSHCLKLRTMQPNLTIFNVSRDRPTHVNCSRSHSLIGLPGPFFGFHSCRNPPIATDPNGARVPIAGVSASDEMPIPDQPDKTTALPNLPG